MNIPSEEEIPVFHASSFEDQHRRMSSSLINSNARLRDLCPEFDEDQICAPLSQRESLREVRSLIKKNARILIVDDEVFNIEALYIILKSLGVDKSLCDSALSGDAAFLKV